MSGTVTVNVELTCGECGNPLTVDDESAARNLFQATVQVKVSPCQKCIENAVDAAAESAEAARE